MKRNNVLFYQTNRISKRWKMKKDTIAAISTGMTNSGIGIVRISGEEAFAIIDRIYKGKEQLSQAESHTIHYGFIKDREETIDEVLVSVMRARVGDVQLFYIRDIFVFASFTALSFVDIKELTNSNIVEVNGEKWILSKRYKTKVPFQVKLLDTPLQIIERYRPCQEDNLIFPNLNYWSICKSLKKGMKECG